MPTPKKATSTLERMVLAAQKPQYRAGAKQALEALPALEKAILKTAKEGHSYYFSDIRLNGFSDSEYAGFFDTLKEKLGAMFTLNPGGAGGYLYLHVSWDVGDFSGRVSSAAKST